MNLNHKRALIRAGIIVLLILALIAGFTVKAGTTPATSQTDACTEEPAQEPQAATEPAETTADETEHTQETEAPAPATEPTTPRIINDATGEWRNLGTYKLTAYCACQVCCDQYALNRPTDENGNPIIYTASGAIAKAGITIAVDPSVIPYGSKVKLNGHTYIAQDCGGAIKGNRIDVYFDNHQEALAFGVQTAEALLFRDAT